MDGRTSRYRRLAYSFMVELADHLLELGNFNAAGQISHGFASPALGKLDIFTNRFERGKPAAMALQGRIEALKALFSDQHNYARYRAELAARRHQCAFTLPCWGIFLGDVFKLDDSELWVVGQDPLSGEPLLNLPKASQVYNLLADALRVADMSGR